MSRSPALSLPIAGLSFSEKELTDLAFAWAALSVAFALLLHPPAIGPGSGRVFDIGVFLTFVGLSFVSVGVGFLCHELAHKVVAIRLGQVAEFRADYQMLGLAVLSALVGFLFAAPGAVYHRGRITLRENGMIALAGPLTNHVLAGLFLPLMLQDGLVGQVGQMGVWINLFLAAFNMIPFGPLDGNAVLRWHRGLFVLVFVPSLLLAGYVVLFVGIS